MATSETDMLTVGKKLDITHNMDITLKAYHKKSLKNLVFLYQPQIGDTTLTQFLSKGLIHKKMKTAK
jgi:hypothetical protein